LDAVREDNVNRKKRKGAHGGVGGCSGVRKGKKERICKENTKFKGQNRRKTAEYKRKVHN
jgi:hypothetical protein